MKNDSALSEAGVQTDTRTFVLTLFLGVIGVLPILANSMQKTWHTEPSPLLLQELQDSALQSQWGKNVGGNVGLALYSIRDQRFEAEWNDTERFESGSCSLQKDCGLCFKNGTQPREIALQLANLTRQPYGGDSIHSLILRELHGPLGEKSALTHENLILTRTGSTSICGVQGLQGYIFAAEGDTLTMSMWVSGFHGPPQAASELMDSLWSQATQWYNKERPAIVIASKLLPRSDAPSGYLERLRYFSQALEGTPYSLGPTGEGRYGAVEPLPIVALDHFDCVTYIESSVGLSLAHRGSDIVSVIVPIRYHGDTLAYATRNHFFVGDWLGNNPKLFRILRFPGDTVAHKTLYKGKLLAAKGLPSPPVDPVVNIPYLPYEQALQLAEHWPLGKRLVGVAFVTHIGGLDVTHTGFVDDVSGKPVLRHASELKGRVVEQDFKEYLESRRGKCAGVLFFEFLPPPGGA